MKDDESGRAVESTTPMRVARRNLAAASLLGMAAMLSMPPLGQQEQIRTRRNKPDEVLAPPPPPPPRERGLSRAERRAQARRFAPTQFDLDRLDAAEAKRARKAAHTASCVAAGATQQLATPRKALA